MLYATVGSVIKVILTTVNEAEQAAVIAVPSAQETLAKATTEDRIAKKVVTLWSTKDGELGSIRYERG